MNIDLISDNTSKWINQLSMSAGDTKWIHSLRSIIMNNWLDTSYFNLIAWSSVLWHYSGSTTIQSY